MSELDEFEQVRVLTAAREADSLSRWRNPEGHHDAWAVRWEDGGRFTGVRHHDGLTLAGKAPVRDLVPEALRLWSEPPTSPIDVHWVTSPVKATRARDAEGGSQGPLIEPNQVWRKNSRENLAIVARAQAELRTRWDTRHLSERLNAAAEQLNTEEPQATGLGNSLHPGQGTPSSVTTTAAWVNPAHIVSTGLRWNDFGGHRPDAVSSFARALIDGNAEQAADALFLPPLSPIQLLRVPGPAGPVYQFGADGRHRIHAARLLRFPLIWAEVGQYSLPHSVTWSEEQTWGTVSRRESIEATAERWRGLLRRGLAAGYVEDAGWPVPPTLHLIWAAAPWLTAGPDVAVAWNRNYERNYPGALARAEIPTKTWTSPQAWHDWVTHRGSNVAIRLARRLSRARLRKTGP